MAYSFNVYTAHVHLLTKLKVLGEEAMFIERDEVKVLLPPCVDIFLCLLLVFDPVHNALHVAARRCDTLECRATHNVTLANYF